MVSRVQFVKAEYFEVSAKIGAGIEEMFQRAAEIVLDKINSGSVDKELFEVMPCYFFGSLA